MEGPPSTPRPRLPTVRDVARLAGVSPTTVSFVLNGVESVHISPATRQRVLEAADTLHYRPNSLARGLRTRRSCCIGVVIPGLSADSFYVEVLQGVEEASRDAGYSVIVSTSRGSPEEEAAVIEALRDRRIDGLLAVPVCHPSSADAYRRLAREIPVVFVDRWPEGVDIPRVAVDHRKGAALAVRHLIELGHTRIAFVRGPEWPASSIRERLEGYEQTLASHRLPFREVIEVHSSLFAQKQGAYQAVLQALGGRPPSMRPTALFVTNDNLAAGVLRALRELRLHVPQEVSVVGFDDDEIAEFLEVPLTTVAQPRRELGRRATELFLRLREGGEPSAAEAVRLQPRLVRRSSSGPAPPEPGS